MPGFSASPPAHAVLLQGTSLLNISKGVIGSGGAAMDTLLYGFHILSNATAVTVTIAGFVDSAGSAASIIWTGSTTQDIIVAFPTPLLNEFGAMTATPSVAAKVWLYTGVYPAAGAW
jgi:hypothetical protein